MIGEYGATRRNGQWVRSHRLRAEMALGRPLPPKAIIHHADGSKRDDAPLVICQDHAYHMLLHRRMRVKALGGDPNRDVVCKICRRPTPLVTAVKPSGKWEQWRCATKCVA